MPLGRLVIYRPDLTPAYVDEGAITFECSRSENTTGNFTCTMPMREEYEALGPDWIIELQRSFDGGTTWVNDTRTLWFVRSISLDVNDQTESLTLSGHDTLGLLDRRVVAYFGVNNPDNGQQYYTCKTLPADDMMRQIVRENYTSAVTSVLTDDLIGSVKTPGPGIDKRIMQGVTVEANTSLATAVTKEFAMAVVSEAVRGVADAAMENSERLLYDMVYMPNERNINFQVWKTLRGVDRTKTVLFSVANGNVAGLKMIKDYTAEATWIHVGGDGQAKQRVFVPVVAADPAFRRTQFYPIEAYIDAPDGKNSQAQIESAGKRELRRRTPRWVFSATAVDRAGCRFGVDYNYGDTVSITHRGQSSTCRIKQFRLRYENGMESAVEIPLESEEIV